MAQTPLIARILDARDGIHGGRPGRQQHWEPHAEALNPHRETVNAPGSSMAMVRQSGGKSASPTGASGRSPVEELGPRIAVLELTPDPERSIPLIATGQGSADVGDGGQPHELVIRHAKGHARRRSSVPQGTSAMGSIGHRAMNRVLLIGKEQAVNKFPASSEGSTKLEIRNPKQAPSTKSQ